MPIDVPGYGRFDPTYPSWLALGADGFLHNVNASDPTRPWFPPAGFRGGPGYTFTPEDELLPPPPVEPPPPPVEPPPPPPPAPAPADPVQAFVAAARALIEFERATLNAAAVDVDRRRDAEVAYLRLTLSTLDTFDAALAR